MTTVASAAVYPGLSRNAVVAASAGTGKTQLLTTIYMAHTLGLTPKGRQIPAERIVATTFSRAAAREIRERLEERLARIRISSDLTNELDPRLLETAGQLGIDANEIARRAAIALDALPESMIDTLHGLSGRILRAHAFEFGLSPDFTILSEEEAEEDAQRVIDDVLAGMLAEQSERSEATARLVDGCAGLERTRLFIRLLLERLDEEGLDATELSKSHEADDCASMLTDLRALCDQLLLGDPGELGGPARRLKGVLEEPMLDAESVRTAFAQLLQANHKKRGEKATLLRTFVDRIVRKEGGTQARALTFTELALNGQRFDTDAQTALTLLSEMRRALLERRVARGTLGFGDLLRLVRDGMRDQPSLALEARRNIDLLLVDEFQDTSRVQRDLLLLLRECPESIRARSAGTLPSVTDIDDHGLVIVGDRKQSIYAFRGADVSVFTRLAAELCGAQAAEQLALSGVTASNRTSADFFTLTDSYRSQPAIVHAVNLIAEHDFERTATRSFEISYTPAEALRVPPERQSPNPGRVTLLSDDGQTSDALHAKGDLLLSFIAAGYIARLCREGTAFREIAILARRRATLPLVELALDRLEIPYVVSGRALYATPEVRDLFAALRLALDPSDRHALAVVARGPLGGLSDTALAELCVPRAGLARPEAWNVQRISDAGERELGARLRERLIEYIETACRLSPRDALSLAVDHFDLEQIFSRLPCGKVRFGNTLRLLEIAARHGGNLAAFVRWLERQITTETDEAEAAVFSEEDDAVRLLTIHGSKGLAFPTVILLDTNVPERQQPMPLTLLRSEDGPPTLVIRHRGDSGTLMTPLVRSQQEDQSARLRAERQRLSYVALTRAKNELALILPSGKPKAGTLAQTVQHLLELGTFDDIAGVRKIAASEVLSECEFSGSERVESKAQLVTRPKTPTLSRATIGVTALSDFAACPRRFALIHVEGIAEPELHTHSVRRDSEEDPRALGSAAHAVLERWPLDRFGTPAAEQEVMEALVREGLDSSSEESRATARGISAFLSGAYARSLSAPGVRIYREFALSVPLAPTEPVRARSAKPTRQLELFAAAPKVFQSDALPILKATFDLAVERADGSVEIIDYKRSRGGDAERYAFQLAAYRMLAAHHFGTTQVRTGLVHLLSDICEPEWETPRSFDFHALVTGLASARYSESWPAVSRNLCQKLRCGFVHACHPGTNVRVSR